MRATALITLTALLAACSPGRQESASTVPLDLPFDEKTLPPITDAELAQAKRVARVTGQAREALSQVLIKRDESTSERARRARRFTTLAPEMQQLVREWHAICLANHQKSGHGITGQPRVGEVYRSRETNQTQGERCPLMFNQSLDSSIFVTEYIPKPVKFGMNLSANGSAEGSFRDPAQAKMVGVQQLQLSFTTTARFERAAELNSSFSRTDGRGVAGTLDFGPVMIEMISEDLEKPTFSKKLTTHQLTQAGQRYIFTQYWEQTGKIAPRPRFFIGNRELTREDVLAIGEFPFDLDQE